MRKNFKMKIVAAALVIGVTVATPITVPFTGHVTVAEAATVKINKTKVTLEKGKTTTLKVTGTKSKVTWKTSNKKVASVSSKGVVKALAAGKANITVTVGKKKYTCAVTVVDNKQADYDQLTTLVTALNAHINMAGQVDDYRNEYIAGNLTLDTLVDGYRQLSEDSQYLLDVLKQVGWKTKTYSNEISLLTETVEALVKGEALCYEAMVNNDESKLTEAEAYLEIYNKKLDEFLTAMGV